MITKISRKMLEFADKRAKIVSALMDKRFPINHHLLKILFYKNDKTFDLYFNKWASEITTKFVELGSLIYKGSLKHIEKKEFIELVFHGFYKDDRYIRDFITDEMIVPEDKMVSDFIIQYSHPKNIVDEIGIIKFIKEHEKYILAFYKEIGSLIENEKFDIAGREIPSSQKALILKNELTPLVKSLMKKHFPELKNIKMEGE